MIVYEANKNQFLEDAASGIEDIIRTKVKERLNINIKIGGSEYNAWKNSLGNAMFHVMNTTRIPNDAKIAIEYSIPRTKNRIDFLIFGENESSHENIIIIELKQWTEAQISDKDAIVITRFKHGLKETPHPSYQAWSYSTLLKGFNSTVYEDNITLEPCAYAHNFIDKNVLNNDFYKEYIEKAPAFCKKDKEILQDFIVKHIKYGQRKNTLYRIENGEIRPSKNLADVLDLMLKGNQEFVLIDEQKMVYETALSCVKKAHDLNKNVLIIEGGPGTGKSVVAINLLVAITKLALNVQYVTKNAAPRAVFEAKLGGSMKKSAISNLFTGSGSYVDSDLNVFDALVVDESHRLNEKSGMFRNLGDNQIKEIIKAAKCSIFFIDENQKVTWQDIGDSDLIEEFAKKAGANIHRLKLESQFRCNGSNGYLSWLDNALQIKDTANTDMDDIAYDFRIMDSPEELRDLIFQKNKEANKSRLVAGYCWDWVSKKNKNRFDIELGENFKMKWNLQSDGSCWIISPDSVNEVGCIHTCQGLELDYIGVIIGEDIRYEKSGIITDPFKRAKTDKSLSGFKGQYKKKPKETLAKADLIIKNTYRTLMTRGMKGCYVYFCDKELENYFRSHLHGVKNTGAREQEKEDFNLNNIIEFSVEDSLKYLDYLPLYSMDAACGYFAEGKEVDIEGWIKIEGMKSLNRNMFVVKAIGKSMEPRILDDSYCIFRTPVVGTRQNKIVLVQHNGVFDPANGGSYSIKKYTSKKKYYEDGTWMHEEIVLMPLNKDFEPIVINSEEENDFIVIGELIGIEPIAGKQY